MFSGIVETTARVVAVEQDKENKHFTMACEFGHELKIDQSVAHNGVCLTVVKIDGITVDDVYVTTKEDSSSFGAMTLTCSKDGETITIRTLPFYEGGELMTERDFLGFVIDVIGVVDTYEGSVQIRVFNIDDITVY